MCFLPQIVMANKQVPEANVLVLPQLVVRLMNTTEDVALIRQHMRHLETNLFWLIICQQFWFALLVIAIFAGGNVCRRTARTSTPKHLQQQQLHQTASQRQSPSNKGFATNKGSSNNQSQSDCNHTIPTGAPITVGNPSGKPSPRGYQPLKQHHGGSSNRMLLHSSGSEELQRFIGGGSSFSGGGGVGGGKTTNAAGKPPGAKTGTDFFPGPTHKPLVPRVKRGAGEHSLPATAASSQDGGGAESVVTTGGAPSA